MTLVPISKKEYKFIWKTLKIDVENFPLSESLYLQPEYYRVLRMLYKFTRYIAKHNYTRVSWHKISRIIWQPSKAELDENGSYKIEDPNNFTLELTLKPDKPAIKDYLVFRNGVVSSVSFLPKAYWDSLTRTLNSMYGRSNVQVLESYPQEGEETKFLVATSVGYFDIYKTEDGNIEISEANCDE